MAGRRRILLACGAVVGMAVSGCSGAGQIDGSPATPSPTSSTSTTSATSSASGVDAGPSSSAFPVQGRDLRLVRVGDEIALQFEFVNGTGQALAPDALGIDEIERTLLLADLPRSTAYEVLTAQGLSGRISESNDETVAPGATVTVTAMFTAPPAEVTSLTVLVDGLLPVDVPVQPEGSTVLLDDPVVRSAGASDPFVSSLLCRVEGPDAAGRPAVTINLSSDVVFAFGSAELSPAAQEALDAVADEIGTGGGTLTVKGHTDSIGDDASNQVLSEQRAAAVRAALEALLGGSFTYQTVGFGETTPIAPNTRPDGSDDPDGRAQNRRVEIRTGDPEPVAAATLEPVPVTTDLVDAGLTVAVDAVERRAGYLMTRVTVTNPTGQPIELGPGSGLTPSQAEPVGLTLADATGARRHQLCRIPSRQHGFFYLANPSSEYEPGTGGTVPPGSKIVFWGFHAAPPPEVTSVDVEIAGFGTTTPTPIRPG